MGPVASPAHQLQDSLRWLTGAGSLLAPGLRPVHQWADSVHALAVCRWTPLPSQRRFSLWMDAHLAVRGQNRGTAAAMMLMSPPSLLLNVET